MERESNVLLVSSQAPPAHPSNKKRGLREHICILRNDRAKQGCGFFSSMVISIKWTDPLQNKQTNKGDKIKQ